MLSLRSSLFRTLQISFGTPSDRLVPSPGHDSHVRRDIPVIQETLVYFFAHLDGPDKAEVRAVLLTDRVRALCDVSAHACIKPVIPFHLAGGRAHAFQDPSILTRLVLNPGQDFVIFESCGTFLDVFEFAVKVALMRYFWQSLEAGAKFFSSARAQNGAINYLDTLAHPFSIFVSY